MNTLEWIEWLLERHWTIRLRKTDFVWEWRDSTGMSGDDYCSPVFDKLPPAVERHIQSNAVMRERVT